uniref:Uncharacterized protein n=1 Tax=Rhizophora mucronata TaxID=61149 RepID=A0A2P2J060_RHIMU
MIGIECFVFSCMVISYEIYWDHLINLCNVDLNLVSPWILSKHHETPTSLIFTSLI